MNTSELTVKYLIDAANSLKTHNDAKVLLIKSHILSRCLSLSEYLFKLPPRLFGPDVRCSNCNLEWKENKYTSKVISKKKLSKATKKKCKDIIRNKHGINTPKAIKKAKEKLYGNSLLLRCFVCNKTTKYNMLKDNVDKNTSIIPECSTPKNKSLNTSVKSSVKSGRPNVTRKQIIEKNKLQQQIYKSPGSATSTPKGRASDQNIATPVSDMKKKRQRDRFAGLSKMACATSTPSPKSNNPLRLLLK